MMSPTSRAIPAEPPNDKDRGQAAASAPPPWQLWSIHTKAEAVYVAGEQQSAMRLSRRLFGRTLHLGEFAGLAGAPDDARVEIGVSGHSLYLEMCDPVAAAYRAHYYLFSRQTAVVLRNDGFCIQVRAMRRRRLGLQVFHRQARHAAAFGVDRIETVAGRAQDENGYYTWPRFGFDGLLPASIRRALPPGLERSRTVLDLMRHENGRIWWQAHGVTIDVVFDLAPGSRSQTVLAEYLRAAAIAGPASAE